jgi:L-ascorbate metabolism protein UlaG (beta-lactamase superfamily)
VSIGGKIIAAALIVFGLALAYALLVYESVPVDPAWEIESASEIPTGAVTVRYTGTATLLFSDGETSWMIDGWFSRPGPLQIAFGKIAPDLEAIERGLAANEVSSLAAVIPVHSHYDHAMDAPEVARRTGALLLGSESTANIGRGWGLEEEQIRVLEDGVSLRLGKFVVTPIVSRHFQFPDPEVRKRALENPDITEPLVPPVKIFDYKLGKAYMLHVQHPGGSALVVGSAGYEKGDLAGLTADVIFLGIGGLGSQTPEYREEYWRETVETLDARRIIPIHYDSLTAPIEGPFRGSVVAMTFVFGGEEQTLEFLKQKEAEHPDLVFQTLPRYAPVVLFP